MSVWQRSYLKCRYDNKPGLASSSSTDSNNFKDDSKGEVVFSLLIHSLSSVFRRVRTVPKSVYSLCQVRPYCCLSVYLSVRMCQRVSCWTGLSETRYWELLWKSVEKIQMLKNRAKKKEFGHFTWIREIAKKCSLRVKDSWGGIHTARTCHVVTSHVLCLSFYT
jgi:hypothetical protein